MLDNAPAASLNDPIDRQKAERVAEIKEQLESRKRAMREAFKGFKSFKGNMPPATKGYQRQRDDRY